jgi:hypothetical protein
MNQGSLQWRVKLRAVTLCSVGSVGYPDLKQQTRFGSKAPETSDPFVVRVQAVRLLRRHHLGPMLALFPEYMRQDSRAFRQKCIVNTRVRALSRG